MALALLAPSVLLILAMQARASPPPPTPDAIRADIREFARRTRSPAVVAGVVAEGEIILRDAVGVQRLGEATPATTRTLFHMASVSKPVVATAIMQLADAGKLRIVDRVAPHVPSFRLNDVRWADVTIMQVLNHTSGLPDVEDYGWEHPQYDAAALDRYLGTWKDHGLVGAPGAAFSYSNLGYEVLAAVIQNVTQQSFESYMKAHVLEPLGMKDSTFYMPDANPRLMAWPHETDAHGILHPSTVFPYNRPHAASSTLYSSVDDMLKFLELHLLGKNAAAVGITESTLARQHTASGAWTFQHTIAIDRHPALGWFEMDWRDRHLLVHEGQDHGFTSMLLLQPQAGNGMVLMSNRQDDRASAELWELTLKILERLPD